MRTPFALAVLCLALLSACKKQESKSVVLAQVGKSTLTLDDLRESFPAEFEQLIRREQYLDFIKRWIDDEAVYQQAKQSKLETDPVVARKLEKMRRKLLIEEYLAHENAGEVFEPDDMAMNQYYEMHKEDFRRKVPEYKYVHIRAQTNKQASELRSKAQQSDFLAVAGANSLDPAPESYASIAFKKLSEVPPCLAQELEKAGIGGVSLPVACSDGFYLVKVLEKQDAGSLIAFPEAKEEISGILILERKDKLQEGRIAKYKEGLAVSYNLDNIPGLSDNGDAAPAAPVAAATLPAAAHANGASPASNPRPAAAAASHPLAAAPKAQASASLAAAPASPAHASASPSASTIGAQAPAATVSAAPANPALPREPWDPVPAGAPKPKSNAKKHARPAAPAATAPDSGAAVNAAPQKTENADAPDTIPSH